MATNTGNKVQLGEYVARAAIDVTQKALPPLITISASYVAYFHGHDISNWIRRKLNTPKKR